MSRAGKISTAFLFVLGVVCIAVGMAFAGLFLLGSAFGAWAGLWAEGHL